MNDVEARVFVTQALVKGFQMGNPETTAAHVTEVCRDMVNVVIDNYLKLRYLTDEQPITGKEQES